MYVILFLAVIAVGVWAVVKLLTPDVNFQKVEAVAPETVAGQMVPETTAAAAVAIESIVHEVDKATRLEALLAEKNKTIERLQKELEAERNHRNGFEKVKSLMDEEIQRLKELIKNRRERELTNV